MPRSPRVDFPGARHHVMNRGARRAPVFLNDEINVAFLAQLQDLPSRFGVWVHGYALMPNHYHLLLETPRGNLSAAMRYLGATFTQRLNRLGQWDGPVFRGRFHNRVVESDAYWRHLLVYLHLNPVRAHLVPEVDQSAWTSHAAYAGRGRTPEWLTTGELLELFGGREGYLEYVDGYRKKRIADPPGFDPDALWRPPSTEVTPAPPRELRSAEAALAEVVDVSGLPLEEVLTPRRARPGNPATWLAAWWLGRATELSQREIALRLGISRSRVSQMVQQLDARKATDPEVARWVAALSAREP